MRKEIHKHNSIFLMIVSIGLILNGAIAFLHDFKFLKTMLSIILLILATLSLWGATYKEPDVKSKSIKKD